MKKVKFISTFFAVVALLVTSCVNELAVDAPDNGLDANGEALVELSVAPLSGKRAVTAADPLTRYVVEIYSGNAGSLTFEKQYLDKSPVLDGGVYKLQFRMKPSDTPYTVLVWADYGDTYYEIGTTSGLLSVKDNGVTAIADLDKRDAYCGSYSLLVSPTDTPSSARGTIVLKHAVAKVVFKAKDMANLKSYDGLTQEYKIEKAEFTAQVNSIFNVENNTSSTAVSRTLTAAAADFADSAYDSASLNVFTDFVFAGEAGDNITGTLTMEYKATNISLDPQEITPTPYVLTNMPIKKSYQTIASGNLFGLVWEGLDIICDEKWDTPDFEFPVE